MLMMALHLKVLMSLRNVISWRFRVLLNCNISNKLEILISESVKVLAEKEYTIYKFK